MNSVNQVSLAEMWPFMEEQINSGKKVRFGPKGTSMLPMIRQGIDSVVLKKAPKTLKKYDLPLFRRKDGQFVLHRVVSIRSDGYVMCGDNQYSREYGVKKEDILAIVDGFYRGDEYVSSDNEKYKKYCIKQVKNQYFKGIKIRFKSAVKHIIRYNSSKK